MPKFLEDKLKKEYGADSDIPYKIMNKMGYMHGSKETAKGKEAERKHKMHIHGGSEHEVLHFAEPTEVVEVNMHQYAPEYQNTSAMRVVKVSKDYDADEIVPNSWDFDEDGDEETDVHGA